MPSPVSKGRGLAQGLGFSPPGYQQAARDPANVSCTLRVKTQKPTLVLREPGVRE